MSRRSYGLARVIATILPAARTAKQRRGADMSITDLSGYLVPGHGRNGRVRRRRGRKLAPVELENAVCLVTGASSGIGRAAALALAAAGARVVPLGRDRDALEQLPMADSAIVADLAREGEAARAAEEALAAFGRVDVLVNNAGIGWAGRLAEMEGEDAERLVAVNLLAPLLL